MAAMADAIAIEESEETREAVSSHDLKSGETGKIHQTSIHLAEKSKTASPTNNHEGNQTTTSSIRTSSPPVLPYSAFTKSQRWSIVLMVAASAFFSPISATIFLPALTDIASDLNVSINAINTTVTVYMVFQGLSPSLWGR